jgi:hypothetical protein
MDIVIRATVIFRALYVLARLLGSRQLAQLTPFELIVLVTMGDLVQQGITHNDFSATGAILAVVSFGFWASVLAWVTYVWPRAEALLAESDFVSLHTPLTPETRGLLDARRLRLMKPTAVLVNTARGPVVDTRALYEVLRDGVIRGAGLDVTDPEPLPADHPLLALPNCVVAPHIASASYATRERMARMAARNVLAVLAGERPPNPVNPEALEVRTTREG